MQHFLYNFEHKLIFGIQLLPRLTRDRGTLTDGTVQPLKALVDAGEAAAAAVVVVGRQDINSRMKIKPNATFSLQFGPCW